ncbi:MAG: 4-hydroxythreonine-4-phosphate dehydrogenase PdxA [Anaerolineae bacterium]
MGERKPILGITMGDPAGVGPEIIVMALAEREVREACRALVVGDAATMAAAAEIVGSPLRVRAVQAPAEVRDEPEVIHVLDLGNVDLGRLVRGRVDPMAGKAAYESVARAVDLALAGEVDAIVTAPLNKEALHAAGYPFAGHTEILAHLCQVQDVAMMLVSGGLRVSHVSTHVSLREACDRVKEERVLRVILLTDEALRRMGIASPRIAVAGLNPHASDGGLFGHEEAEEIAPAVQKAQARGLQVEGPLPPDTVFYRAVKGHEIGRSPFDAVVAMYHDQGHIPIKLLGLFDGVNVTLGLPIIRTSVDHGTAFGKAGKGTASPVSLIAAINLAVQMVRGSAGK